MSPAELVAVAAGGLVGFAVAAAAARMRLQDPPEHLIRTNVRGLQVPVVLGGPLVAGALASLIAMAAAAWAGWGPATTGRAGFAVAAVVVVMAAAGALDDRRGDEAPRGFRGHLGALRGGKLTGGILKIAAGAIAGGAAAAVLFARELEAAAATVLLVALGSNAINLFDRAPGRASKVFLAAVLPLMALGHGPWTVAVAGAVGALVACLPLDLNERAMLGDAGANPLGALLGLGLAVSADGGVRWVLVVVLLVVNAASERWSFSRIIEQRPWLERLDRIGRK